MRYFFRLKSFYVIFVGCTLFLSMNAIPCFAKDKRSVSWRSIQKKIERKYPHVSHISTTDLYAWLQSPHKIKPILLDVRTKSEYDVSHLFGAQLILSEKMGFEKIKNLEKDIPLILYCSVGERSSKLAAKLKAKGFKNIYNLQGSIFKWANEGKPVYSQGQKVNKVHPYNSYWGQLLTQELWFFP